MTDTTSENSEWLDPVARLSRDLRLAAATLSDAEARYLVDSYYIMQDDRKRSKNQERALTGSGEPHTVISWLGDQSGVLEKQILYALDTYTSRHKMGDWMRGIYGVGPVISAGLLANIYMGIWCNVCRGRNPDDCKYRQERKLRKGETKFPVHDFQPVESCPTVGHIWAFAGIAGDDQKKWEKGKKRPWNNRLKELCWKIGDSFVKFHNDEKCVYGKLYAERKEQEVRYNEAGKFKHVADERIARDKKRGERSKEAPYHDKGILSPGHLDLKARRYATKIFLSHLHAEWYRREFNKEPPAPFPIAILGHAHFIPPPS